MHHVDHLPRIMNYCELTFKNLNGDILNHIHLNHKGINTDNVYSFGTPQHVVPSVHIFGILSGQIITDFFCTQRRKEVRYYDRKAQC